MLSAFEFDKRWREIWVAGQGSGGQEHDLSRAFALWRFLGKLDFSKIPNILGSLLEPELLVQLLQGFSHLLRISTQANLGADIQLRDVEAQFLVALSALPKCQRFETSLMFLDEQERSCGERSGLLDKGLVGKSTT
ncbi:RNA-polymerase II-associated protein 3-like, C-terminal domain [Ceraceosorus bombacis]|uniref:RNA-polymerase II-associated protein 3-like, C-terminal domain n=1 Tax=Ceraceosorus bombacis TaxID=401625 RepID=A0A0P1BIA7_9BASI|nr:RNA-polymerase II-associated protein 3-like, C-terminal domain [Ceraceosorus bombacis]